MSTPNIAPRSPVVLGAAVGRVSDRKSTRLNSSHLVISYAVFCLKKKTNRNNVHRGADLSSGAHRCRVLYHVGEPNCLVRDESAPPAHLRLRSDELAASAVLRTLS